MAETPAREVSMAGKMFGMSLFGTAVAVLIVAENVGAEALVNHAAVILAGSLLASIALPMLFFRRAAAQE